MSRPLPRLIPQVVAIAGVARVFKLIYAVATALFPPGSVIIPAVTRLREGPMWAVEALKRRLDAGELEAQREGPVPPVRAADRRLAKAARPLAEGGFSDVQVVAGGMTAWHGRGWPVES